MEDFDATDATAPVDDNLDADVDLDSVDDPPMPPPVDPVALTEPPMRPLRAAQTSALANPAVVAADGSRFWP